MLGCLIEKQLTTPQQYPLTLNALVAACNQASSRDPVTAYREDEVVGGLEALKARRLVRFVLPSHGRSVVRYRHVLDEALGLDGPQLAVLAVLVLRGPQTAGELRARTERMAELDGPRAVDHELELLAGREDPLVVRLARRPGQKEERWADLVAERPAADGTHGSVADAASIGGATPDGATPPGVTPDEVTPEGMPTQRIPSVGAASSAGSVPLGLESLRAELAELRDEVAALRSAVAALRESLGG